MQPPIRDFLCCFGTLFGILGCTLEDPDPPSYPPLDARALVGCWQYAVPKDQCSVDCFGRNGGYFHKSSYTVRYLEAREDSGIFSTNKYSLNIDRIMRTTTGKNERNDDGLRYTIIRDTMMSITSDERLGGGRMVRVHPDSFPCGLKPWTLFQKPLGWDSLIQPY